MFAWIAAVLFSVAAIISGGDLHPSSAVLSPVTPGLAGLICVAVHMAPKGR